MADEEYDVNAELLDAARYGEAEEVADLLKQGANVNHQDAGGNTALHKACANSHLEVVQVLVRHGAKLMLNESQNSPLHWCIQNKAAGVVKFLLANCPEANVLLPNSFGKSCVSEAFNANDMDILNAVLSHPSAKGLEEHYAGAAGAGAAASATAGGAASGAAASGGADGQGGKEDGASEGAAGAMDVEEDEGGASAEPAPHPRDAKITQQITHRFLFADEAKEEGGADAKIDGGKDAEVNGAATAAAAVVGGAGKKEVVVREIGLDWTGEVFDKDASRDTTGTHVWAAALLFGQYLFDQRAHLAGKSVVELGAGCGLPGLVTYVHAQPKKVLLTDLFELTLNNLKFNAEANRAKDSPVELAVQAVDWSLRSTYPPGHCDVVLGCDLIYDAALVPLLVTCVDALLAPGGTFYYCFGGRRHGGEELLATLAGSGFEQVASTTPMLRGNPLVGKSEAELHVHFNELDDNTTTIIEFRKAQVEESPARAARRAELEELVRRHQEAKVAAAGGLVE